MPMRRLPEIEENSSNQLLVNPHALSYFLLLVADSLTFKLRSPN